MNQRILLAGGTGLIGGLVRARLAGQPGVDLINLIRQGSSAPGRVIDFEALVQSPQDVLRAVVPDGLDLAICCLGTTQGRAGSKAAMFRVDHDYVVAFAKGARALGARHLILMSAAGSGGAGFYLETKGKVEEAVARLGFDRVDFICPGLLLGYRSDRTLWAKIGAKVYTAITPLLIGPLARFGAIPAEAVADAMVQLTAENAPGLIVHHNRDLQTSAGATA